MTNKKDKAFFEGICKECHRKGFCSDYQKSKTETDRVLFGCSMYEKGDDLTGTNEL